MATQKFSIAGAGGRLGFDIFAEEPNINFFLKTAITPVVEQGPTNKQISVISHQRRQYPGDATLSNVAASNREVLVDPTRKSGNGLPGKSFVLVGDPGMPGEERRQFTYNGRWIDVHAWLRANVKMLVYAYNHTGARYEIPAAGTTP